MKFPQLAWSKQLFNWKTSVFPYPCIIHKGQGMEFVEYDPVILEKDRNILVCWEPMKKKAYGTVRDWSDPCTLGVIFSQKATELAMVVAIMIVI